MEEMSAFERQVASVVQQSTMPPCPVDAMRIMRTATATRPSGRTIRPLFSVTKLVVAAVIVALFGGFLLAGILTTPRVEDLPPAAVSPFPVATEELLSGMATEEVEPGVLRVLDDGVGHART